jgi:hypothetical protein
MDVTFTPRGAWTYRGKGAGTMEQLRDHGGVSVAATNNGWTTDVSENRAFRLGMLDAAAKDLPRIREELERQYEFSVSLETVNTAIETAYVSGFESGYHEAIADLVKRGVDVRLVRPGPPDSPGR